MPNPYVTSVDRDAFWNQYRSTPEPALMMKRPPRLIDEPLYRGRWPYTGPYAATAPQPYDYSKAPMELPPIMEPLPEGMLPTAPLDVDIAELGALDFGVAGVLLPALGAAISAYHGFKRNDDSAGWAVAWGLSGWFLWPIVPIVAVAQGYGEREAFHKGLKAEEDEWRAGERAKRGLRGRGISGLGLTEKSIHVGMKVAPKSGAVAEKGEIVDWAGPDEWVIRYDRFGGKKFSISTDNLTSKYKAA